MSKKDEAMKLALEALEYFSDTSPTMAGKAHAEDAITAITQARSTPVQEPVAWVRLEAWQSGAEWPDDCFTGIPADGLTPLYTTPPGGRQSEDCLTAAQEDIQRLSALVRAQQITIDKLEAQRPVTEPHKWVGLTDEEMSEVYNQADWDTVNGWEYERAIEAKLKEKNT